MDDMIKKVDIPEVLPKDITDSYEVNQNTFILDNGIDNNRIETEIGDIKQSNFKPQIKIKRWDNEYNFSARLIDDEITVPSIITDKEKIIWENTKKDINFYELDNGYEFEIILKEKPKTNIISFTIQSKGLRFSYQIPFIETDLPDGYTTTNTQILDKNGNIKAQRPENISGSYSVYIKNKKRNYTGGKLYKYNKFGHIFKPKIFDNDGKWTWGKLNIENDIMTVEIPQDFLDNAIYPIRHASGATFGYLEEGGTAYAIDDIRGQIETAGAGTATKATMYCIQSTIFDPSYIQVKLYNSDYSELSNGLSSKITMAANNIAQTLDLSFGSTPTLTATSYYIATWSDSNSFSWPALYADTDVGSDTGFYINLSAMEGTDRLDWYTPLNTYSMTTGTSFDFSVYVTYTPSSIDPDVDINDSISITEDTTQEISNLDISIDDDITITEDVSISVEAPSTYDININDDITITEDITINRDPEISVYNSIEITEDISLLIPDYYVNIYDEISISEDIVIARDPEINVNDSILITEDDTKFPDPTIDISESISITEDISLFITDYYVNINEEISTDEDIIIAKDLTITIDDSISITESSVCQPGWCVVDALVGRWRMNEDSWNGSSSEVIDLTNYNNHGTGKYTIGGSTYPDTTANGKLNRGGELAGTTIGYQYIDCGNDDSMNLTSDFAFECWINPSEVQEIAPGDAHTYNHGVASKVNDPDSSTEWSWQLRYGAPDTHQLGFQFNQEGGGTVWITAQQDLTTDTWYHVIGNYDGTNIKFYLNSIEKDSNPLTGIANYPDTSLLIGNEGWANNFLGKIDEVRIYNHSLTQTEISGLYNQGDGTEEASSETDIASNDGINISEDIDVDLLGDLEIDIYDSISILEDVSIIIDELQVLEIDIDDSLTITDELIYYEDFISLEEFISIDVFTISYINIYDSVSILEDISINISDLNIEIYDSISITEDVNNTLGEYGLSVNDEISINEDIEIENSLSDIEVNDSISIGENIDIDIEEATPREINIDDSVSIDENTEQIVSDLDIGINDNITINDDPTITIGDGVINVSDYISINENIEPNLLIDTEINEQISITEDINRLTESFIIKAENITIVDSVERELINNLSVNDEILIDENLEFFYDTYNLTVSNNISIEEVITVRRDAYIVSVSDNISITESNEIKKAQKFIYKAKAKPYTDKDNVYNKKSSIYSPLTVDKID